MRIVTTPQVKFKGLANSQGNTILGVLCLIAASVAAFQISFSDSLAVNGGIKNSRILSARDALESRIKNYSSMGATFRSSMHLGLPITTNSELRNCVFGTGSSPCLADGKKHPIALYNPIVSEGSSTSVIRRITGPDIDDLAASDSAFYDNKGNLCLPNDKGVIAANCPFFEVRTSFTATCPGNAASCATAESITVNYTVMATKLTGAASQKVGSVPMASFEYAAPAVSVVNILPAKPGSASSNVTISLSPSVASVNVEAITSILKSQGEKDTKVIDEWVKAIQDSGITDTSKYELVIKAGHPDPAWIKLIVESGITYLEAAQALYWVKKTWTPEQLAATVDAVSDIKIPEVAYQIAANQVTDKKVANDIAKAVEGVKNPAVAGGIIAGGYYTDAVMVDKISKAVSHIPDPYADYMAQAGITDKANADKILNIVKVIDNSYSTGWMIIAGGGDVAKTQQIVDKSIKSTTTAGTPATTTTTTTTTPAPTPTAPPVEISLMPPCTTCTPMTY